MFALKLVANVLYPAYATFKAFRTKNATEYVKWMTYWIVFAIFTFFETFADLFFFWLPFYDEGKILTLIWLILPVWKDSLGSGIIYKNIIHPFLIKNEAKIDLFIEKLTCKAINTVTKLAFRAVRCVSDWVLHYAVATMITPKLVPPVAGQNVNVFSSDSEGDSQEQKKPKTKKSLKKKKVQKKK